jgi:23S rRNA (uridine2552-2'-O)-methyltransferase
VGPSGVVVGIDIDPIKLREKNVKSIKMDVHDQGAAQRLADALGGKADVVLSDLAPDVTGVWELDQSRQVDLTLRVLDLSRALLKQDGAVFCKLFEGERSQEVRDEFRRRFRMVRVVKPAASRNASSELYYYCQGQKPPPG